MVTPDLFGIIAFPGTIEELPDPANPYYILSGDSIYVHKQTAVGKAILPQKFIPDSFPKLPAEFKDGSLILEHTPLPKELVAQVWHFFARIYEKSQTEAEVLISKHKDGRYRVFVPSQRVTGTSVKSLYDAGHIQRGWAVIGSIHSHCNFGAFHSGTDTADASGFNGFHITIGNVNKTKDGKPDPSFAAMVMLNGIQFNYDIERLADISDLTSAQAPNWWDRYVITDTATTVMPAHAGKTLSQGEIRGWAAQQGYWSETWGDEDIEAYRQPYADYNASKPKPPTVDTRAWVPPTTDYVRPTHPTYGSRPPNQNRKDNPPVKRWNKQLGELIDGRFLDKDAEILEPFIVDLMEDKLKALAMLARSYDLRLVFDILEHGTDTSLIYAVDSDADPFDAAWERALLEDENPDITDAQIEEALAQRKANLTAQGLLPETTPRKDLN